MRPLMTGVTLAVAMMAGAAHAQERESLEALRQTTINLIEALVQTGALTREKADAIIDEARRKAAAGAPASGAAAASSPSDAQAAAKPVQRVPYISESVRAQIRNELKEEVIAQARQEKWGVPNAPSWTDRIRIEGDFRMRYQHERPDGDNTSPQAYYDAEAGDLGRISRAPDFAAYKLDSSGQPVASGSTQDGRSRERIRLRLGLTAKVSDEVGVGVRLATGNGTDRVSTNQTLGQNFNKYQLFVDRAFVKLDPLEWLSVRAGRIPNPWFSTDMIWSENLNFEGLASTATWWSEDRAWGPFATVGWFPVSEQLQGLRARKTLAGVQVGSFMQLDERTKVKVGLAYYRYRNIEGREDTSYTADGLGGFIADPVGSGLHEYPVGLRQKGNTVFETQPGGDPALAPVWGLAYRFAPVALTASAEFSHFSPYALTLSGEYVYNTDFDAADFRRRAGSGFAGVDPGGKRDGYQLRMGFGWPEVDEFGKWQVNLTYRHLGSDAVLDAFTDSDLGLGGTNLKGYSLGVNYGLARNTSLGLRYLSAKSIDSTINETEPGSYGVNLMQVDFNVRF
ncbi:MAG: putative porin [Aquabacterium sp.]